MLGTLKPGDRVLSLVAQGRSHPSVQQAAEVMGATFQEVQGLAALERAMHARRLAYAGHHAAHALYVPPASR